MNITDIKYFLSLARCLNFSQAAEENYISQSSFSKTIMRLERDLNTKLVDRGSHPVTLTAAGKCFYQHMRRLEPQFQSAMQELEAVKKSEKIKLLICPNSYQYKIAFDAFLAQYQDANLQVESCSDISLITEKLHSGKYDFIISPRPFDLDDTAQETVIYEDEVYLLTSDLSAFAKRRAVSLAELDGTNFYESHYSRQLLYALSNHYHFRLGTVWPPEGTDVRREECIHRIKLSGGYGIYAGRDLTLYHAEHIAAIPVLEVPSLPVVLLEQGNKKDTPAKNRFRKWITENLERYVTPPLDICAFNGGSQQN